MKRPLHLLVLECDAEKLAAQGLFFAESLAGALAPLKLAKPNLRVVFRLLNSQQEFTKTLIECAQDYSSVHNIIVVAHSNRSGLRVAPGFDLSWKLLGRWLERLKPKNLGFVACEAGQHLGTRELFDELKTCRKVYASPFKSTKNQFEAMKILFAYLLVGDRRDEDVILVAQCLNFLATGGVILECTRRSRDGNRIVQLLGSMG